ncbi:membrane protein [Devosia pacifica]|uniref:Membrane protein n=1 Tax=Devosia pacifica TaxID=1335967 RepID=A0A918SFX9_9HYPH|nr:heparan-alpha-glucosaminide N-acetyltransferase [Devosia pacifica]GHA38598.1 membrane protein [Devosia pacifica]
MTDNAATPRRRFALVDITRGVALIAMVVYHLFWDLSYFRFIASDVGYDPAWVLFARSILAVFLFLVGVGLVLGHGRGGIHWRSFWRRWVFVVGGALAISVATWFAFPQSFVYFGVLHAIALFSLMGLAFVRTPLWLAAGVAAVVIVLPFFYSDAMFNEKAWSWIGFWQVPPPTNDLVPVFPGLGVVLLGVVATRLVLSSAWAPRLEAIAPAGRLPRLLAWLGRWSLLLYLVHQPILLGLVYPASLVFQPQLAMRSADFLRSCQSTCQAGGTAPGLCTTYCQCGVEGVETNRLWNAIETGMVTAGDQALLDAQNRQCSALICPDLNAPQ